MPIYPKILISKQVLPKKVVSPCAYRIVRRCELQFLRTPKGRKSIKTRMKLQSFDDARRQISVWREVYRVISEGCEGLVPQNTLESILSLLETFENVFRQAQSCTSLAGFVSLSNSCFKQLTGKSLTICASRYLKECMDGYVVQSDDGLRATLNSLRDIFDVHKTVTECDLARRVTKMYSYMLTQGFLSKLGWTLNDVDYTKMEKKAMIGKFSNPKSMLLHAVDTAIFVLERYCDYRDTGDVGVFVHDNKKHDDWLKEAERILSLADYTSNLGAHGTNLFTYLTDLDNCIATGESIMSFSSKIMGGEVGMFKGKLSALIHLKNEEITKNAARKERAAPFGVLIAGSSGVCKSTFRKVLFSYYGALFDLPTDDKYMYTRNPIDKYWSGQTTDQWATCVDDAGFMHPKKCTTIDPSLEDLIHISNNTPYCPPQADIKDKGRTPILSELLLVTTNCIDLNAHEYFWCPLAARRRLPFVVKVEPKPEFLAANKVFMDTTKLKCEPGQYPNYWVLHVYDVVPQLKAGQEDARLNLVKSFADINEFLAHFGEMCIEHKRKQKAALSVDNDIKEISVCKLCRLPEPHVCQAVQSDDAPRESVYKIFTEEILAYYKRFMLFLFECFVNFYLLREFTLFAARMRLLRRLFLYILNNYCSTSVQYWVFRNIMHRRLSPTTTRYALLTLRVVQATMAGVAIVRTYRLAKRGVTMVKRFYNRKRVRFQTQGNKFGTTEADLPQSVKANPWHDPKVKLSSFDVPTCSRSLSNKSDSEVTSFFQNNCVLVQCVTEGNTRTNRGVFLRGHSLMVNAHTFEHVKDTFELHIHRTSSSDSFSNSIKMTLHKDDIVLDNETDVAFIEVRSMPPFKDIYKYWAPDFMHMSSYLTLVRNKGGSVDTHNVRGVYLVRDMEIPQLNKYLDVYVGRGDRSSFNGLCGSLCISNTPKGPILFGIHVLGKETQHGALYVSRDTIDRGLSKIEKYPSIQCGIAPSLSCSTREIKMDALHPKSVFAYMEYGNANVYGSSVGFRPQAKSKVVPTPLSSEVLDHYNVPNKYGPPMMGGYMPYRNNVIEMVKPKVNYNRSTLDECVDSFIHDIVTGLPTGWERGLVTLSDMAAVNGLPGVCYIDGINRNTSAGFPFMTSKSKLLESCITDTYPDGVTFVSEIWDQVREIEAKYARGERANPVYSGQLKDEATSLKKIQIGKTRLFTGAPIAHSLVVRKKLLSFVALLQTHKYVFEAGPGTVCQSTEWTHIRSYLTQFGEDRMVAGDYGKFDKHMIADFIRAAYHIIAQVHKHAGFSDDAIREIYCIGEDTAFPVCFINGDLVEFYGTNPSGHPLTVIINSLVNSLYMRYCYMTLNPLKEVRSFKKNVSLFTYGDDNVCGVSTAAPWFNHTAIQREMANIGVEYTMADKEAASVPFINIRDISFLKRRWVWNEDIQAYACPLEEDSIIKSLTMWVPSGSVDKHKQMVDVITSANFEYFNYGRTIFEEKHAFFKTLLQKDPFSYYVEKSTLPTYDELVTRFIRASEALGEHDSPNLVGNKPSLSFMQMVSEKFKRD